jgi:hypothetical protein|tara:strand:+ start:5838 stop:5996 length:159 start_codon:yes stop_codon:yes gene_type:complete
MDALPAEVHLIAVLQEGKRRLCQFRSFVFKILISSGFIGRFDVWGMNPIVNI